MGFLSNFVYWSEAGYFDATSHEKWLLHTWSLSVEWQFYIIYPLVLLALRRFLSIKTLKLLLIIGTVLGFIFSVFATYKSPSAAYYLFHTRAWEMMLGGVAYLYPFTLQENRKKLVEWTGLALVVGSYFLISAENAWPGYLALFPVLGSFLIIQAQRNDSLITGNIVFQKLGTWSYSIYLWHWPFVVAIYTFSFPEYYVYLGMALSIILGFLSYKYVEKIKFRNDFSNLFSYFKSKPIYIAGVIGVLGSLLFLKSEALTPHRFSAEQIAILHQLQRNPREAVCGKIENGVALGCTYGDGPVKAIVTGDSHSLAQMVSIGNRAAMKGGSILSLGKDGCATVKNLYKVDENGNNPDYDCAEFVSNTIDVSAEKYSGIPVIIINRTSTLLLGDNEDNDDKVPRSFVDKAFAERDNEYLDNMTGHMVDTICEFAQNHPVYLVRPIPEVKQNVPNTMFRALTLHGKKVSIKLPVEEYNERHKVAIKMQDEAVQRCGVKILDPISYSCDNEYCYGDIDGTPLYFDDNHLSSYGSKLISPIYDEVFK